jgi:hypothetical protein
MMGREAEAHCTWRGESGPVKALLESRELILRGAVRTKIARADIRGVTVKGEALHIDVAGELLILELGAAHAARWATAILKPPPSLAGKLGISAATPALLIGEHDDAALTGALAEGAVAQPGDAAMLVAVLGSMADLAAAFAVAEQHPALPIWCVYAKGPKAEPGDSAVRAFMRDAGWMDSKSCAVSDRLTATRYGRKR